MGLGNSLRILLRWSWLIVLLLLVTVGMLWFQLRRAGPVYEATVELQLFAFTPEEVAASVQVMQADQVRKKTTTQLGLEGKAAKYELNVRSEPAAGTLRVTVGALTPSLAKEVANTHIGVALAYYGELISGPVAAQKQLLAERIDAAQEELQAAEDAFAKFRAKHNIGSLDGRVTMYERTIYELQLDRDERVLEQVGSASDPVGELNELIAQRQAELDSLTVLAPAYHLLEEKAQKARDDFEDGQITEAELLAAETAFANFQAQNSIASLNRELSTLHSLLDQLKVRRDKLLMEQSTAADTDAVAEAEKILAQREKEIERLTALAPEYNLLSENVLRARYRYRELRSEYIDVELKEAAVQPDNSMQIVKPARTPSKPASDWQRMGAMALASSLALGILLAFSMEYAFPSKRSGSGQSSPPLETPASEGQEESTDHSHVGGDYPRVSR